MAASEAAKPLVGGSSPGRNLATLNAPLQAFMRAIVAEAELKGKPAEKERPRYKGRARPPSEWQPSLFGIEGQT
jgi:hypothetical protein